MKNKTGSIDSQLNAQADARRDAYKVICKKLAEARAIIAECEQLAQETGASFDFQVSYGMGGSYNGETSEWESSSQNC